MGTEYRGEVYVMVRQFDGKCYMVPKAYESKFNRRTKLVIEHAALHARSAERTEIINKIIRINRSIPKSVIAWDVEAFNRMVCRYQIPTLKMAAV